jgi:hypothetical protein
MSITDHWPFDSGVNSSEFATYPPDRDGMISTGKGAWVRRGAIDSWALPLKANPSKVELVVNGLTTIFTFDTADSAVAFCRRLPGAL